MVTLSRSIVARCISGSQDIRTSNYHINFTQERHVPVRPLDLRECPSAGRKRPQTSPLRSPARSSHSG